MSGFGGLGRFRQKPRCQCRSNGPWVRSRRLARFRMSFERHASGRRPVRERVRHRSSRRGLAAVSNDPRLRRRKESRDFLEAIESPEKVPRRPHGACRQAASKVLRADSNRASIARLPEDRASNEPAYHPGQRSARCLSKPTNCGHPFPRRIDIFRQPANLARFASQPGDHSDRTHKACSKPRSLTETSDLRRGNNDCRSGLRKRL